MVKRSFYLRGSKPPRIILRRMQLERWAGLLGHAAQGPVYIGSGSEVLFALGLLPPVNAWLGIVILAMAAALTCSSAAITERLRRDLLPP